MQNFNVNTDYNDFVVYLAALSTYFTINILDLTNIIDLLCKIVSLAGFAFVALNQGSKFFNRKK